MKKLEKLKDSLMEELKEYEKKGKLSAGDITAVHMLTDTIKNIDKICMLEEDEDYSQAGEWNAHGRSYGNHYGRYSRNNYSSAREMMADSLRDMSYADGLGQREKDILHRAEEEMRR